MHARITGALERVLQEGHGLRVSECEVLERVAAADKDEHRMQELAESVHLSQSALSRYEAARPAQPRVLAERLA